MAGAIDLVYTLSINEYRGERTLQLMRRIVPPRPSGGGDGQQEAASGRRSAPPSATAGDHTSQRGLVRWKARLDAERTGIVCAPRHDPPLRRPARRPVEHAALA